MGTKGPPILKDKTYSDCIFFCFLFFTKLITIQNCRTEVPVYSFKQVKYKYLISRDFTLECQ